MISKLGFKRLLVLSILAGSLAVLYAANTLILTPKVVQSQQEASAVTGEVATIQSDLEKMRGDFNNFQQQKELYDKISGSGFFGDQDRVVARERFDTMQKLSKIISARYEIKAAKISEEGVDPESGYVVMDSPITIDLSALDDVDVYRFVYLLNYGFPGHITINSLTIERKAQVTPEVLKSIGTGNPQVLVGAKMELDWRTMVRKDEIKPDAMSGDPSASVQAEEAQ